MGIKNKTLLKVSILMIVMIFVVSVGLMIFYSKDITNKNVISSRRIIENASVTLENYVDDLGAVLNEANYNYYLQNYLINEIDSETGYSSFSNEDSVQMYELSTQTFSDAINTRNDIVSIMIFGKKTLLLQKSSYAYQYVLHDFSESEWYEEAIENRGDIIVTGPNKYEFLLGSTEETLTLSKEIQNHQNGTFLGVIMMEINLNGISELIDGILVENDGVLLLTNASGERIYLQENQLDSWNIDATSFVQIEEGMTRGTSDNFKIELDGTEVQVVYEEIDKIGWSILSITPLSTLQGQVYDVLSFIVLFAILILAFLLLLLNIIMKNVTKPIVNLKMEMDKVDRGNLEKIEILRSDDELEDLGNSFNSMISRIQNLETRVTKEQEQKRRFELQALQGQINPHFLYNTLDTIIWMAEVKDEKIVKVTEALAKLFRISLNRGKQFITVEGEVEHVKNYLIIQKTRYMEKFTYSIELAEEVKKLKTIKLLLQPIVENSIYHGIKQQKESGEIKIKAYRVNERLCFEVSDNGMGMDEEQRLRLVSGRIEPHHTKGSGIGVKNVNERIQIFFGKTYGLHCESTLGEGTTITLSLPIIEDETVWEGENVQDETR